MSELSVFWLSRAWEQATGADSIATIMRVYPRRVSGAYECVWPDCRFARRDAGALWRHVHTAHEGGRGLPPAGFDPEPWKADELDRCVRERDRYVRAFNRLEKAVADHVTRDCIDSDGLAHAHRMVLRDLARGSM